MRVARAQATVAWGPSRHRFALFRLLAFLRLISDRQVRQPHRHSVADKIVLAIDRDQSTVEAYTVGIFVWMTIASFIAATMAGRLTLAAAIVVALPLSALALSAAVVVAALVFNPILHAVGLPRGPSNITPNSTLFLIGVTLAASYFATWPTWARVPAWIFLGTVMLNGVCSAVLFLLRHRVRAAELRCAA